MKLIYSTIWKLTKMKTNILTHIFLLGFAIMSVAQPGGKERKEERNERVEAAKISFITTRLNLNTSQAQQFWPLYNEYEVGKKKIRKQLRQLKIDNLLTDGTEDQLKADIKKMFSLRQEELDLEKSASEKFLKVLSARQVVDFYRSEKEFMKMLLKRLKGGRKEENGNEELKD